MSLLQAGEPATSYRLKQASALAPSLVCWQRVHGRHGLPWQGTTDPYRVWLSEIMLQQTQVSTVLDYYPRFLRAFPTVASLAAAPLDEVLAQWSGLGYYSRARNLHRCAQQLVARHAGQFPPSSAALAELPGIGRSTAAAVAAFCFGERVAILDGNVKRVLSRVLGFGDDLAVAAHERRLWQLAQELMPEQDIAAYTQGLMDLGAGVCSQRAPDCQACPWAMACVAHAQGQPQAYPVKTRKLKRGQRHSAWLWLCRGDALWLTRRPDTGVWAGLWSLPEWANAEALLAAAAAWPGQAQVLPAFKHVLTHLDWTLQPCRWTLPAQLTAQALTAVEQGLPAGRWVARDDALAMGLPAPLRRLLQAEA